ncbi:hypothetical protein ACAG26_02700 [Mycobacterium sp. pUA109]|uniref:hypothetical protein n=1 Tax=Mycobacterium sp. pUA109 TaxID=3238982 RepID=UPI00351B58C3
MTFGGPQPAPGWWLPASPPRPSPWPRLALVAAVVAAVLVSGVAVAAWRATGHRHDAYRPGDCVVVEASTGGELHASRARCDTDPSFTVAKLANPAGGCAPSGYDRFAPPSADDRTGHLCLVPNLVAGHCYRLGVAVGVWNLVDCTGAGPATIRVTQRLDTDDARACAAGDQLPARSYPAPPRTYCLGLAT